MVRGFRGVNLCELAFLHTYGEVSAKTAPFAPVREGEVLKDTFPPPPPGTLCLFRGVPAPSEDFYWRGIGIPPEAKYFGEFVLEFLLPEALISWEGIGRYYKRDCLGLCKTEVVERVEFGVEVLPLTHLVAVHTSLTPEEFADHLMCSHEECWQFKLPAFLL